jgi:hypothetical protein
MHLSWRSHFHRRRFNAIRGCLRQQQLIRCSSSIVRKSIFVRRLLGGMPDAMELPHASVWVLIYYHLKIFLARSALLNQAMNIDAFP